MTTLSDGAITLRPVSLRDVDAHFEAARESCAEVGRWLPWCHEGYARSESREWLERCIAARNAGEMFEFLVFDTGGRLLGGCGLNRVDRVNDLANMGYWVRSSAAGRGVATAAARLVARFGIEQYGLARIEVGAAVGNIASQRVAEKIPAVREGVLRRRLKIRDEYHDMVLYSVIADDLR